MLGNNVQKNQRLPWLFVCSLSGLSPFAGDSEHETLSNVTSAVYDYDAEEFCDISLAAKDFINKLLVKQPESVMSHYTNDYSN